MNILLVAATRPELEPLLQYCASKDVSGRIVNKHDLDFLFTGVGMTATAFSMGQKLAQKQYDLALNCGIAGAFDRSLRIGEVTVVNIDCFSELGAEDGNDFIPIDLLGLGKSGSKPASIPDVPFLNSLRKVRAITVNRVHGNDETIFETAQRLNPQVETMEGAAFFYACNQMDLPCIQIRSISNYVERRNRENWNLPLAVENLNSILVKLLNDLS